MLVILSAAKDPYHLHVMWQTYLTVAVVAYLLGSIPFGYILVKLFLKQDIRQTGSGNIGATNVARSGKKGLAIATLLLDAGKGALALTLTLPLGRMLLPIDYRGCLGCQFHAYVGPEMSLVKGSADAAMLLSLAALFAIVGHMFPIWLKFKGGKGVATAIGAFGVLAPQAAGLSLLTFAVIIGLSKTVSLSSIISAVTFPIYWWLVSASSLLGSLKYYDFHSDNPEIAGIATNAIEVCAGAIVLSSALVILKHHANIRRLLNGTEPKFTTKKKTPDPVQVEKNA